MNARCRLLLLLAYLLIWVALPARPVQAHANLVRSDPASGAVLKTFPTSVQLEYSEAVDPHSVSVELLDDGGQVLEVGILILSQTDPRLVMASFPEHPNGVYSFRWRVGSDVDGHITFGTIPFSVGPSVPRASLLPPPGAPDPATDLPSTAEIAWRWLGYLSIVFLVGPVWFAILAWRPAVQLAGPPAADWDTSFTRQLRLLILWGAFAAIAGLLGQAIWQTAILSGLSSRMVLIFLTRLVVFIAIIALVRLLPPAGLGRPQLWWAAAGLGAILLVTYTLSGHNAAAGTAPELRSARPLALLDAAGSLLPLIGDGLHLAAMTAWLGGLLPLAFVLLRQPKAQAGQSGGLALKVTRRFSTLALVSVIVIGLSGFYSALIQVRTLPALLETRYGQALLVKTALFGLLIGVGAVNQRIILPAMARSDLRAFRWLARTVPVEYGLGLLLLIAVGALMSLSPAFAALKAEQSMGYHEAYHEGPVQIDLRIAPAQPGENEFGVDVRDGRPGAVQKSPTVLLRFSMVMEGMDMGGVEATATPSGPQRYTVRGSYLPMSGDWQVQVIVRKPGFNDVQHTFTIELEKPGGE